ncbi:unnamed protein product [Calypogeia fissa]
MSISVTLFSRPQVIVSSFRSLVSKREFARAIFAPLIQLKSFDHTATRRAISGGCRAQWTSAAEMVKVKAIKVNQVGGPEALSWEDIEVGEPGEGQVRIRHTAIGLNFIDVYFRTGVYKSAVPFIPGMEAAGVVTAVGPGLTGRKVGDRVAYAGVMGAYCEERLISADKLVPLPSSVDDVTAAAVLLKGMTAQFLLRRCFKNSGVSLGCDSELAPLGAFLENLVERGHAVLVHAAAGGVGSLLVQWAHALGATVIAAVSTEDKAAQAKEDGADHVLIYSKEDFATRVKEITNGAGVQVVYDSVGKDTFQGSLDALAVRGYFVSYGQSSGMIDPMPVQALAPKSLFLTRPSMMAYTSTRDELLSSAGEVFAVISEGILKIRVNQTYPLAQVSQSHSDLEARKTSGSTVLTVDSA